MLPLAHLRAHLQIPRPRDLPILDGQHLQGGTGVHLRQACCPNLGQDCYSCEISQDCIFYFTHMKKASNVGYAAPPKPVVLIPPFFGKSFTVEKDGYLDVDILLYGKFIRYLPHVTLGLSMLGQSGIGSERRYDVNKFNVAGITCAFSGKQVYDGSTINVGAMKVIDIMDYADGYTPPNGRLSIGFDRPMVLKTGTFPPPLDKLIDMTRQRLILYVNEYGDGSKIPDFECTSWAKSSSMRFHRLKRASQRAGKGEIHAYTGTARYTIGTMDDQAKTLLKIGELIGAGPKPSFGLGFYRIIE